jgi:MSHA pilin protein MshD
MVKTHGFVPPGRRCTQAGVTLLELVISIVVTSIAVVTLVLVTSEATRRSVDPLIQEQAGAIALAYLEEIMQKEFCDPDDDLDAGQSCPVRCTTNVCGACRSGDAQESSRDLFDDICDYDGMSDSGARNLSGSPVPGLGEYTVNVDIDDAAALHTLQGSDGRAARIDVTVTHPAMEGDVTLSGFRTNH